MFHHLRHRPALLTGLACILVAVPAALLLLQLRPVTALLAGWDCGVLAYAVAFVLVMRRTTPDRLAAAAARLDEGSWGMLLVTVTAAVASLGAIVAELAQTHGNKAQAGWLDGLAGATVLLSWLFVHAIFATHYAHEFWRRRGLLFPGNDAPNIDEFLYFSFCMAVASQVSDVSTQSAAMRRLVLAHSLVSYLFNTAIIALGVNIAASLAS